MAKKGSKFKRYSKEHKLKAVHMYLTGNMSFNNVAINLNIKSDTQVKNWVKLYSKYGESAFDLETRGRRDNGKIGRSKTKFKTTEEELEYLRMENEYLKKLRALQRQ